MNCYEFWNGEEHPRDHLAECASCAARWSRHQEITAGLHALGREMQRIEAPARVERKLVSAFRAGRSRGASEARGSWWMAAAWAAALAVTALLAVALIRPHAPERTHRVVRSRTQLASVEQAFDASDRVVVAESDAAENGFLPLPSVEAVGPNDEIDVVRVEVPRSAMIPLGFSVPAERAQEMVTADVMLDGDGIARAVRFLDSEKGSRESTW